MLHSNWLAMVITFVLAIVWLRLNDYLALRGVITSRLSRKIIHMGTGPIFVLCWLLFPNDQASRYFAAVIPLAITFQFLLIGIGVIKDQASVDGMSRSGDPREILRGPLFYGIVFVILTVVFWLKSPIGIIALMLLCGGDGLADILGNRIKSKPLPWSTRKSVIGSLSMFAGGWIFSVAIIAIFINNGVFAGTVAEFLLPLSIISLAGTLVESLPLADLDNLTVPAAAVLLGLLFF